MKCFISSRYSARENNIIEENLRDIVITEIYYSLLIVIASYYAMISSLLSSSSFVNGKKKRYIATRFPHRTSGSCTDLRTAERS